MGGYIESVNGGQGLVESKLQRYVFLVGLEEILHELIGLVLGMVLAIFLGAFPLFLLAVADHCCLQFCSSAYEFATLIKGCFQLFLQLATVLSTLPSL